MHPELPRFLQDVARLKVLSHTGLTEGASEEPFDRHTRRVAELLAVPIAVIALVDDERLFFKSALGVREPFRARRGMLLSRSLCQHVVTTGRPLAIDDARVHPLVHDQLDIHDFGAVAYLGAPLTVAGAVVGSLCAMLLG